MQIPQSKRAKTSKAPFLWFLFLAAYIVLGCWIITQWYAHKFGYQAQLGEPAWGKVYAPFKGFVWYYKFYRSAPEIFANGLYAFVGWTGVGMLGYVMSVGFLQRSSKVHETVHGTATWGTEETIRESGLLPPKPKKRGEKEQPNTGVYVGAIEDEKGNLRYMRHDGPEHVAAIAPTRSGKGVSLVVPTLLSWPASVVVNDIKGELWHMTAGWRSQGAKNICLRFDPAAERGGSVSFNPLAEIRVGTEYEVGDTQNLVTIIVDPDGTGKIDHWARTAHAFLTGVILHLAYLEKAEGRIATLPQVVAALSDPARPITTLYKSMLDNTHWAGQQRIDPTTGRVSEGHPTVAQAARDMLDKPDNERGSVLSTAMSFLVLYRDPLIAHNVSRSDFRVHDLMNADRPVSLYLVVNPANKDRMRPLMRLVINQIVRGLVGVQIKYEGGREVAPHKHRMLLMLDEFPSYGRLDVFQESLAYIAGYGIKAYLIMQDISQLHAAYTRDESIISNCHVRVAFAPNRPETAKWISDNCGVTTVVTEQITTSGKRFGALAENFSRTYNQTQRPLLTPDEASRLKAPTKDADGRITEAGEVLVLVAGRPPVRATQSLYFLDPVFSDRAKIAPPPVGPNVPQSAISVPQFTSAPAAPPSPSTAGPMTAIANTVGLSQAPTAATDQEQIVETEQETVSEMQSEPSPEGQQEAERIAEVAR